MIELSLEGLWVVGPAVNYPEPRRKPRLHTKGPPAAIAPERCRGIPHCDPCAQHGNLNLVGFVSLKGT